MFVCYFQMEEKGPLWQNSVAEKHHHVNRVIEPVLPIRLCKNKSRGLLRRKELLMVRWLTMPPLFCNRFGLHVWHAWKETYTPECLFPVVKVPVRAVLVTAPGTVYIHSVPQHAGKCQKPTTPVWVSAFLNALVWSSWGRNITRWQNHIHGAWRVPESSVE